MNEQNQSVAFLEKFAPDIAEKVRGGYPIKEGLAEYKLRAGGSGEGVYGTPIYGKDEQGNTVLGVISKDGRFQKLDTGGVDVSPGVTWQDFGTYKQPFDSRTNKPLGGPVPVENFGAASDTAQGTAEGKARGEARASLPGDLQAAGQTVKQIDELMNHPGLDSLVGPVDQYRGSMTLGREGRDAKARFEQLKGRAFLEAYALLKGGGQITEVEGLKAEQAMARMQRDLSEEEFRQALKDFRDAVVSGMTKLQQAAGGGGMPAGGAPAGGAVDLKSKYGLE